MTELRLMHKPKTQLAYVNRVLIAASLQVIPAAEFIHHNGSYIAGSDFTISKVNEIHFGDKMSETTHTNRSYDSVFHHDKLPHIRRALATHTLHPQTSRLFTSNLN